MNNFKYLRKAAFAVAFGLTTGKFVGELVNTISGSVIDSVANRALAGFARGGNKSAIKACEDFDIEYEEQ